MMKPRIIGRSSSVFTRVARMIAMELGVDCDLVVVRDLLSCNAADYGGNPALKLPVLETQSGVWFGAVNIGRVLQREANQEYRMIWPELLSGPLLTNAQELVLQGMATEVQCIMSSLGGPPAATPHQAKMQASLSNTLAWLETHLAQLLTELPTERDTSYLELTLFCFVTHLEFRHVLDVAGYANLSEFCRTFAARPSARDTPYRFDP